MKKLHLLIMLGFLFISTQEMSAQGSDGIFSYKNVVRIEKASSTLGLLSLLATVGLFACDRDDLSTKVFNVFGFFAAVNTSANIGLGCGYKKEKKAFVRAILSALVFVHPIVHGKVSKDICSRIADATLIAYGIGLTARECADLYYLIRSQRSAE